MDLNNETQRMLVPKDTFGVRCCGWVVLGIAVLCGLATVGTVLLFFVWRR